MTTLPPAVALLLLAGCADLVGIAGDCSAEMRELRQDRGQPTRVEGPSQVGGNYAETWIYGSGDRYTFRWGASYGECQVEESRFSRSPALPPPLSQTHRGDGGRP